MSASAAEQAVRVNLAAAYRLAALNGWDDTIYTHISAAVPGEEGVYLINPFGLLFDEVCASNLVKVNTRGEKLDDSPYDVNPTGFAIHGAIHAARPSAGCVLHLHTHWGMALAMLPDGLLPTTQHAMRLFKRIGRHVYEGLALGEAEAARLVANLGTLDGLILENHGTLTVGASVAEAYMLMHHLERAARAQLTAMAATGGAVLQTSDAVAQHTYRQWVGDGSERDGDAEWPALLRRLDKIDPSYRS
ncbi:MAG: class II aldolase/adducin family protein [Gammaproteobacteria bacterium]|nr:class II aldolase/adducin family protein [Gammaproteobacteria bacterium]MBU0787094.1 class II aldolase/adducin family protein [Gammaproteobacteria bacterium]MBU0816345.1 class II aldolase/adducin family protein [Gammaproteobacteria bacterium]MBU1787982.1 class II aldolase/adducin family protein [Gammaproteobacteria bacterium]